MDTVIDVFIYCFPVKKKTATTKKTPESLTFVKMGVKNLVKVTRIGEVMDRERPPTLRSLPFQLLH